MCLTETSKELEAADAFGSSVFVYMLVCALKLIRSMRAADSTSLTNSKVERASLMNPGARCVGSCTVARVHTTLKP